MKRNIFDEPIPANLEEIETALREFDMIMDDVFARIDFNEEDESIYSGFTAEIMDEEDQSFTTAGYTSRAALVQDLRDAGIIDIENY